MGKQQIAAFIQEFLKLILSLIFQEFGYALNVPANTGFSGCIYRR